MKSQSKVVFATMLTLANTQIGAAMLSLPFTFSRLGFVIGLILLIFAAAFSILGFSALVDSIYYTNAKTMRGMIQFIFGNTVSTIIDCCIALMYTGFLISYDSIFSDYVRVFIQSVSNKSVDVRIIKAVSVLLFMPMTAFTTPAQMSKISAFALFLVLLTIACVIYQFVKAEVDGSVKLVIAGVVQTQKLPKIGSLVKPMHSGYKAFLEVIQRVPLFMPLFGCHPTLPPLFHDLPAPNKEKHIIMKKATFYACIFSFVCYCLNTFCSYFMFGRQIQGNVFLSFSPKNYLMTTMRLLYALAIAVSFGCIVYPIRAILMDFLRNCGHERAWFYSIGVALAVIAVVVSILVPDIVKVFNVISSLFGIAVYWVIPVITRWKNPELAKMRLNIEEPEEDKEKIEKYARQSFMQTFIRQSVVVSRDWQEQRIKTYSIIQQEMKAKLDRQRAQTIIKRKQSIEQKKLRWSMENRPSQANDILRDIVVEEVHDPAATQEKKQEATAESEITAALQAVMEIGDEPVKEEEKPSRKRLVCMIVACVAILVVNLTAFSLSTFYDMGTK